MFLRTYRICYERIIHCIAVIGLMAAAGCDMEAADTGLAAGEQAFLERCRSEVLHLRPDATTWVDRSCVVKWRRTENATAMAEAILALLPKDDPLPSADEARARLPMVQWSSGGTDGMLHELNVHLPGKGNEISFYWQQQGSEAPYSVVEALRLRGVGFHTLGCPQYPGASMGREKVMRATLDGISFTLAVYNRPAPIGIEPGIYAVDVDFSDAAPDMAALRAGRYPGGGGRAFAVDPIGWAADCPDPE